MRLNFLSIMWVCTAAIFGSLTGTPAAGQGLKEIIRTKDGDYRIIMRGDCGSSTGIEHIMIQARAISLLSTKSERYRKLLDIAMQRLRTECPRTREIIAYGTLRNGELVHRGRITGSRVSGRLLSDMSADQQRLARYTYGEISGKTELAKNNDPINVARGETGDVFDAIPQTIRAHFRLFYDNDMDNLERLLKNDAARLGGAVGPFGGIVQQAVLTQRYAPMMAMYAISRHDVAGLCGERGATFTVTSQKITEFRNGYGMLTGTTRGPINRREFVVPHKFAEAVRRSDIKGINPRYARSFGEFITRSGGCNSSTLRQVEAGMLNFYYKR